MKSKHITISLRLKIIAIILLVLPLGGYAVYHYEQLIEHDMWHVKRLNQEVTADGARMVDDIVEKTFTLLRVLARHPAVLSQDSRASHQLFMELLEKERHLMNIFALDREGRTVGSAIYPESARKMRHRDAAWFREALKGPIVGDYHISSLTNEPTLMVALPVLDKRGEVVGVLAAPLQLEYLASTITRGLLLQECAFLQVIDGNNTVIVDTSGRPVGRKIQYPAASADGNVVENDGDGKQLYTTMMPMRYAGLRAVVGIPLEDAFRDARLFGRRFLLVFLALGGVASFAGLLFAKRIGERITEISKGLKEMEKGNLDVRLVPKGRDELRYVAEQFNAMADARSRAETELRQAVALVSEERAKTQAILESIADGISIQDTEFRILYQNAAHKRIAGEHAGAICYQAYAKSDRICDGCPVNLSFQDGKKHVHEKSAPAADGGTISVDILASPLRDASGRIIASIEVLRDITQQKMQERSLSMNERFASLGRMASGIAHEINNPLAAINGCAEGLMMRIDRGRYEPQFFKEYLKIIQEEIFRCKNITTGMLSFTRQTAYEKGSLDIRDVARKAVDLIGFQGRLREVEVVMEFADDLPRVFGSEGELRQVFLAILTNALDAMHDRGTLTLSANVENGSLVVCIADTGAGIASDNINRIFDPFFTTKADKGGTGLGLAIANKIVLNHQGAISVTSEVDKGTCFKLSFTAEGRQG